MLLQKTESGDSGNEEPDRAVDFYTRNECQGRILMPSIPGKTDRLVERLTALTTPREYEKEKVPDGLVDSLPPEGKNLHSLVSGLSSVCKCFIMVTMHLFFVKTYRYFNSNYRIDLY